MRRRRRRAVELGAALGQRGGVPARAVLVGQRDVAPVAADAGVAARVVDEHERQQAGGLGVVGHQLGEQAPEADRLRAQLGAHEAVAGAGGVALVEDEVDDGEHAGQAIGHLGVAGDAVGDPGRRDLALGAHQALGHRRLGHEEGARDLRRGQPAEGAQGQRDAGVHRQRGVTAGEDEAQAVVFESRLVLGLRALVVAVELHERVQGGQAVVEGALAAQAIDRLAPRRGGDPGARVGRARRRAARWPARRRRRPGARPRPAGSRRPDGGSAWRGRVRTPRGRRARRRCSHRGDLHQRRAPRRGRSRCWACRTRGRARRRGRAPR